jgi:hypothetical protein
VPTSRYDQPNRAGAGVRRRLRSVRRPVSDMRPDHQSAEWGFSSGDRVWVDGRRATFCYLARVGAAVVKFEGEQAARVVAARKVAADPAARRPK